MRPIRDQPDDWWSTQPISRVRAQGYTHLRVWCPCCRHAATISLDLIFVERSTPVGDIKPLLRCQRCGDDAPGPSIGVARHPDDDEQECHRHA